jgi:hypothetical protein
MVGVTASIIVVNTCGAVPPLVAACRMFQGWSDRDADPDGVKVGVLADNLVDGPTQGGAERPGLEDPPNRGAGGLLQVRRYTKNEVEFIE